MKLLLDTHVLIWFAQGSDKLSQTAEELVYDRLCAEQQIIR